MIRLTLCNVSLICNHEKHSSVVTWTMYLCKQPQVWQEPEGEQDDPSSRSQSSHSHNRVLEAEEAWDRQRERERERGKKEKLMTFLRFLLLDWVEIFGFKKYSCRVLVPGRLIVVPLPLVIILVSCSGPDDFLRAWLKIKKNFSLYNYGYSTTVEIHFVF